MPDMSKFSQIVYGMQNNTVPGYNEAIYSFLQEGFPTEMLLSLMKKIQQPSPALINAYLYICGVRNEVVDAEIQMQIRQRTGVNTAIHYQDDSETIRKRKLLADLDAIIAEKKEMLSETEEQILQLKTQMVELEETVLLQDFGLYQPTYNFATSEQYKARLDDIRAKQKQMIKDKTAATCRTNWTVNGSRREGKKLTNDNIKQVLLTFNTECEHVIDKVKFNNFDSMKKRIQKIYDKLNT